MDTLSQTSMSCDFSSPSSPINSKKYFSQSSPVSNNSSDEVLSSNFVHLHPNGVSNDSPSQNLSPASSFGSLNFNLTQELQDHPLFQSPKVDRSVSIFSPKTIFLKIFFKFHSKCLKFLLR